MTRPLRRQEFFVLAALLEGPLHGYGVTKAIEERTAGAVRLRPANLYRILDRLVGLGLLAETEPSGDASGGAERSRFFAATAAGRRAARAEARLLADMIAGSEDLADAAETPWGSR